MEVIKLFIQSTTAKWRGNTSCEQQSDGHTTSDNINYRHLEIYETLTPGITNTNCVQNGPSEVR